LGLLKIENKVPLCHNINNARYLKAAFFAEFSDFCRSIAILIDMAPA